MPGIGWNHTIHFLADNAWIVGLSWFWILALLFWIAGWIEQNREQEKRLEGERLSELYTDRQEGE